MLAMAHVDAEGVGASAEQLLEHFRGAAGRPHRGEDLDLAIALVRMGHGAKTPFKRHETGRLSAVLRYGPWTAKTQGMMTMDTNYPAAGADRSATPDALDTIDDAVAAAAFRRLVRHLRHRHDAQNIDLMGLAGFCRNCLADWIVDAGAPLDKAAAREAIHGLPAAEWKSSYQTEATPEQLERMAQSVARNDH